LKVGLHAQRVEELAEEASGGRGGGQVEDLLVPVSVSAEPLDVGGGDLIRAAGHLLGERHRGALAGSSGAVGAPVAIAVTVGASNTLSASTLPWARAQHELGSARAAASVASS
jgi:hypothetical protein